VSSLVLVRHGRTEANARGLLLGRLDVALDELGRRQARAVADAVLETTGPIAAVVSSPLLRTRETAAAFGLPVQVDDRFVELDYGELDGRPLADVPPEMWAAWRTDPSFRPPGGETLAQVADRVVVACREWARAVDGGAVHGGAADGGAVVVVTHVSPLKAAVAWALGVGDETGWRTRVDPASISRVAVDGPVPVLRSFNETGHLAGLDGIDRADRRPTT
jgi:probable phosphoglycerate mutase